MRRVPGRLLAAALAMLLAGPALAHDGAAHQRSEPARGASLPFPVEITARFSLIDQNGRRVTEADFAGQPVLLFFGYANCRSTCPVALPAMAEALDRLGPAGAAIVPLMITVDPERDTPEAMRRALARHHPRLVGLTGTEAELAAARRPFQVEVGQVAETPDGPIYAHGSFIYLLGPDGRVAALLPPILSPDRMAEVIADHLNADPDSLRPGE